MYGTVTLAGGDTIDVEFGSRPDEPVLYITDLSIHFAKNQTQKPLIDAYDTAEMNVFAGSVQADGYSGVNPVKENVLRLLNAKYGMVEEDLVSAELELVPVCDTRDAGLDGSALVGYGFDDRAAVYAQLYGTFESSARDRSIVSIFVDKEEVHNTGHSGSKSRVIEYFLQLLAEKSGFPSDGVAYNRLLSGCKVLSLEAVCGHDANHPEIYDDHGGSLLGYGLQLMKLPYRSSKVAASEVDAEFMGRVRNVFNENGVIWQPYSAVSNSGGFGTVSTEFANLNMEVVDAAI